MNFSLKQGGQQTGPYPVSALKEMLQSGALTQSDMVLIDGASAWMTVSECLKVAGAAVPPPIPEGAAQRGHSLPPRLETGTNSSGGDAELVREIEAGGRFVVFPYCVSVLVLSFKRSSGITFLRGNEDGAGSAIKYSLISLLAGWWGIPWGPIWTIASLVSNAGGGRDVTREVLTERLSATAANAILARRQPKARAGALLNSFRAFLIGIPLILVLLISFPFWLHERGPESVGEAAFRAANGKIDRHDGVVAMGNSSAAVAVAGKFSSAMKSLREVAFESGKKSGYSASKNQFLTFCDLRDSQCIILVHVPELRKFTADAKDAMCSLAWAQAQAALRSQATAQAGMKLIVGVRGFALYERVMTGVYVPEAAGAGDGLTSSEKNAKESLYQYFENTGNGRAVPAVEDGAPGGSR